MTGRRLAAHRVRGRSRLDARPTGRNNLELLWREHGVLIGDRHLNAAERPVRPGDGPANLGRAESEDDLLAWSEAFSAHLDLTAGRSTRRGEEDARRPWKIERRKRIERWKRAARGCGRGRFVADANRTTDGRPPYGRAGKADECHHDGHQQWQARAAPVPSHLVGSMAPRSSPRQGASWRSVAPRYR